jgi:hypothetical protein
METIVILVVAAGVSAAVVWWVSAPPRPPRRRTPRPRPITLRESFQPTAPEPLREVPAEEAFIMLPQGVLDERPPRLLSLLRLVLAIAFVAALAVGAVAALGYLIKLQLDKYLGP